MQGAGNRQAYRVIGILAGEGPLNGTFGRTVVVPLQTAQAVFADTAVTRVDIGVAAGTDIGAVSDALVSRLVTQPYVLSTPRDIAASLRSSTSDFQATTALVAAIALFAGAFLIFNTLSMTVVEQVREVGLLRAAGATRRQVTRFMLSQALVVGVLGSVLGLGLGALLAAGMVLYVRTIGSITLQRPAIPPMPHVIALLVGIGVTLAAALEPARRAGRIQPVEALKARLDLPSARRARLRWLAGVFVIVTIVGLIAAPRGAGALQALVVYAVLLVGTLCIPLILPAVARLAGIPFGWVLRLEERLARSAVVRDPGRSTLTLGALTIGLAMIVALGGVGQHARAAAGAWIADVVPGELILSSIRPIAADEGVEAEIQSAVPSIARISPIATFDIALQGARTDAAAVVGADMAADGRLRFTAGDRASALAALDAGGATIVPAGLADRSRAWCRPGPDRAHGQRHAARSPGRRHRGTIDPGVRWGGDAGRLEGCAQPGRRRRRCVRDPLRLRRAGLGARRPAERSPAPTRSTTSALDRITGAIDDALGRIFGLFDALAAVAVLIAALGIVNTLTMNVIERVREIGILRAAGMTRRQVWRSVVVEAGILGLAGAVLGVILGLIVGGLMVVLAGGPARRGDRHPVAGRGAQPAPRRRGGDARGRLSGAPGQPPPDRARGPVRMTGC